LPLNEEFIRYIGVHNNSKVSCYHNMQNRQTSSHNAMR
jgi:hypothetical protein